MTLSNNRVPLAVLLALTYGLLALGEWFVLLFCTIPSPHHLSVVKLSDLLVKSLFCGCMVLPSTYLTTVLLLKRRSIMGFTMLKIVLFLIELILVALFESAMTGRGMDSCFFDACCGVLGGAGHFMGFTYKESCVIGNIYMEGAICLLTALWVTWSCISCYWAQNSPTRFALMTLGIIYGAINLMAFAWVCHHYAMPLETAYDHCFLDMLYLAKKFHTTYNMVNYVIFIFFFLAYTLGNVALSKMINKFPDFAKEGVSRRSFEINGEKYQLPEDFLR